MDEFVDYHIHSKYSDGELLPQEIINYMRGRRARCISITDHNTIKGYSNKLDLSGIRLISGVEADVNFGHRVQLLCYDFDINDQRINERFDYIQLQRNRNSINLIKKMNKVGINVENDSDIYEYINDFDRICKIIKESGFGDSVTEVKNKYFLPGGAFYFDIPVLDTHECIQMFQNAGGKVVLAHPGRISYDMEVIDPIVQKLLEYGLDGIECYHPDHDDRFTKKIVKLTKDNKLLITGGSDMHARKTDYYVNEKNVYLF